MRKAKGHPLGGSKEGHSKLEDNKEILSQIPEGERDKLIGEKGSTDQKSTYINSEQDSH